MALRRLTADDVSTAAQLHGVPPELALAIWKQESDRGNNTKISPKGAVGAFQIMPPTFKRVMPGGNIHDPVDNMLAGLAVMKEGLKASGGDPEGAAQYYYHGRVLAPGEEGPDSGKGTPTTRQYGKQIAAGMGGGVPTVQDSLYGGGGSSGGSMGGGLPPEERIPNEERMPNEEPDIAGLTRPLGLSQNDAWMGQQGNGDYELEQYVKQIVDQELGRA